MTTATAARSRTAEGKPPHSPAAARLMDAQARHPAIVQSDRAAETAAGIGAEMARFGAARLHAAIEAQQEMLGCRTAGELREVHTRYVHGAMNDYAAEWLRMWEMGLGLMVPRIDAEPVPAMKRHATPV